MVGVFVFLIVLLVVLWTAETAACTLFNAEPGPIGVAIDVVMTHLKGPRCPMCRQRKHSVDYRRRNTAYHDDDQNFHTCCAECHDDACQFWSEMWQDHYNNIRF